MGVSGYLTILRWAGAKKNLIPRIQTDSAGCFRYVEPFLGSAAVLLNLGEHMTCIGGDENEELIEALRTVRDYPTEVVEHFSSMKNEKDSYLEIRQLDRSPSFPTLDSTFKAARFIYLNHTCFNGLYRVNMRGEFNVPFGSRRLDSSEVEKRIRNTSDRLRALRALAGRENLLRGDYKVLLDDVRKGDFYYLDPPYSDIRTGDMFVGYTAAGFGMHHHSELLHWMKDVIGLGVRVMMSNSSRPELVELARELGLSVEMQEVRRKIAASNAKRGVTEEAIIVNY